MIQYAKYTIHGQVVCLCSRLIYLYTQGHWNFQGCSQKCLSWGVGILVGCRGSPPSLGYTLGGLVYTECNFSSIQCYISTCINTCTFNLHYNNLHCLFVFTYFSVYHYILISCINLYLSHYNFNAGMSF